MDLGTRLTVLLEDRNMTQKEFADCLHIDYNTANGYVTNRRMPDCEMLCKIAEIFHSSADYLVGRTSIRHHRDLGCSHDEGVLISNYRGLSPDMRQALVAISESLYQNQRKNF